MVYWSLFTALGFITDSRGRATAVHPPTMHPRVTTHLTALILIQPKDPHKVSTSTSYFDADSDVDLHPRLFMGWLLKSL